MPSLRAVDRFISRRAVRRLAVVVAVGALGATAAAVLTGRSPAGHAARSGAGEPPTGGSAAAPAQRGATGNAPGSPAPACDLSVSTWSVPQLANQLLMVLGNFTAMATVAPDAATGVGGIDFLGQPTSGSEASIAAGIASLGAKAEATGSVAPWISTTEEGGEVTRLAGVIGAMPSARQLASESTATITATAQRQGAAMRSLGITMNLAPVVDAAPPTDPYAAESSRSFSDTAHVAAADGLAFAKGMLAAGIEPVVKHFPGLGHASGDTDTGPATDPPLATLEDDDLVPFDEAAATGLPVIMVGHVIVPGLTGGMPASLSSAAYAYLRTTVGFAGVAMTDALGAGAISAAGYDEASAAVAAIEAGADMAMVDAATWAVSVSALEQAMDSGQLPLAQARTAASRIVAAKGMHLCPAAQRSQR